MKIFSCKYEGSFLKGHILLAAKTKKTAEKAAENELLKYYGSSIKLTHTKELRLEKRGATILKWEI